MPVHKSSSLVNSEYFRDHFSVDSFLVRLTEDVIDSKEQRQDLTALGKPLSNDEAAKATIDRVQKLIRRFIQAEYEVTSLGEEATEKLLELQQTAGQDETHYQAEVRALELVSERIKDGIRDIDSRISRISQTATRVGDRLQTAEGLRLRCLEAQELIAHLQAFSCHTAGDDFTKLPSLFNNDATLMEAAAVSRRLAVLSGDVVSAKQRTKLAPSHDPVLARTPGNTGGVGSVEHTLKVLESYCNWLENRIVSRFDAAVAEGDLKVQAQCVAIMAELDQEKNITQRWVASRPMFLAFSPEMLDDWVRRANMPPASSGGQPAAAAAAAVNSSSTAIPDSGTSGYPGRQSGGGTASSSRRQSRVSLADTLDEEYDIVSRQAKALDSLYRDLYTSVTEDISDVQEVFSEPQMVLEMFLQRLLEQNVQAALERLLLPSGMGMQALAAATAAATAAAEEAERGSSPGLPVTALGSFKERATSLAASFSSAAGAAAAAAAAAAGSPAATAAAAGGSDGAAAVASSGNGNHAASSALLQQQQLRLLEQAYLKTQKLSVRLEKVVAAVAPINIVNMAEGLWPAFLGSYPTQELNWLAAAYQEQVSALDSSELSLDVCLELMAWNAEATERALNLSAPGQAARNCRMLFHHLVPRPPAAAGGAAAAASGGVAAGPAADAAGESGFVSSGSGAAAAAAAHPGCLLEQLARHIIGGVEYSLELCSLGGNISNIFKMRFSGISKASSSQLAADFVNEKVRKALEAAHVATQIVGAVQSHYSHVVSPAVSESASELSAASSALLALIHAVEDSITVVLRKSVDTFMAHMERALSWEQRRSDFTPRDDVVNFAQPTSACLLGTALLTALRDAVQSTLDGPNKHSFMTEVCGRCYQLLLSHMTRFTYSPTGALKWKKDVNEYAEVLCSFGVSGTVDDMLHMQQLVNVLVVAPDSLVGLVNGSLRMTHRDALRFISLREDFKTAKVDGRTLLELFSGDGLEGQLGQK